jgi:hypothetical protein
MTTIGLMALAIAGTHLNLNAQEAGPATRAESQVQHRMLPFHGKLKAIDPDARTVVVGSRTFRLTDQTKYLQGSPQEAKIGDKIGGSYWTAEDGSLMVNSIRFGEKPGKEPKTASEE